MIWSRTSATQAGRPNPGGSTDERQIAVRAFGTSSGVSNLVACAVVGHPQTAISRISTVTTEPTNHQ